MVIGKCLSALAIVSVLAAWTPAVNASLAFSHSGAADPITEGFGVYNIIGSATVGPVHNDFGYEAWSINGTSQGQQYIYTSGPVSVAQQTEFANQGFTLTVVERVLQNQAPVYTSVNPVAIGAVSVSTGAKRFDIALGLDSNGDTVVVLPNDVYPSRGSVLSPGTSFTLPNSGSSYHTYQLVYNPVTSLSDLSVDGIVRLQNYAGYAYSLNGTYNLIWAGINGGQANFNSIQLTSSPVPIPGTVWLGFSGMAWLAGLGRKRKKI